MSIAELPHPAASESWQLDNAALVTELAACEEQMRRLQARQGAVLAEMSQRGVMSGYGYADVERLQMDVLHISRKDATARAARARACHDLTDGSTISPAPAPHTGRAFADGTIGPEHVDAIVGVLADIPGDVPADERGGYETTLVQLAKEASPNAVRKAGRHLLAMLNQDGDEPGEPGDKDLAEPERELGWAWTRDNQLRFKGTLDSETGQLFQRLLSPLAKPRPALDGEHDPRTSWQRNGDAFAELLEHAERNLDLPTENGEAPTVIVTMTLNDLMQHTTVLPAVDDVHDTGATDSGTGIADDSGGNRGGNAEPGAARVPDPLRWPSPMLNFDTPITAEQARRYACDSRIIPAVLGSRSEILDLGRETRTATRAQRRALALRDRGCTFPACDRPVNWTQAHHIREWEADNGPSDISNMTLICGYHHRLVHHSDWNIVMNTDGHPDYIPPPWLDPERKPRRNNTHHPIRPG